MESNNWPHANSTRSRLPRWSLNNPRSIARGKSSWSEGEDHLHINGRLHPRQQWKTATVPPGNNQVLNLCSQWMRLATHPLFVKMPVYIYIEREIGTYIYMGTCPHGDPCFLCHTTREQSSPSSIEKRVYLSLSLSLSSSRETPFFAMVLSKQEEKLSSIERKSLFIFNEGARDSLLYGFPI